MQDKQIRISVPEDVHEALQKASKGGGRPLNNYVRALLVQVVRAGRLEEFIPALARPAGQIPSNPGIVEFPPLPAWADPAKYSNDPESPLPAPPVQP